MGTEMKRGCVIATLTAFLLWAPTVAQAQKGKAPAGKPQGPPPTLVAVAPITEGSTEPMTEFVGTIYYARISEIASEVEGLVDEVFFEEGRRVKKKEELVRLNTEMLDIAIEGARGTYEEMLVDLEEAEKGLNRIEPLYREKSVAEVLYDEHFFRKKRLERKTAVLETALDRQLLERKKMTILAPFDGIVVRKAVEKGEWVSEGGTVAVVADDREVDVVVDVPGVLLQYLHEDRQIDVTAAGRGLTARFVSFVPKGDIATRTFAVKLRMKNTSGLVEGMEARALLPSDKKSKGFVVPRDAVIDKFGRSVVFLVQEGAAAMVPVTVTGYDGLSTGVTGPGLKAGLSVVVKGNERLRDGQPVRIR